MKNLQRTSYLNECPIFVGFSCFLPIHKNIPSYVWRNKRQFMLGKIPFKKRQSKPDERRVKPIIGHRTPELISPLHIFSHPLGVSYGVHIGSMHVLGGIFLLSLLAAFEVFSIPAAKGIINLIGFTKGLAGWTWIFIASVSGGLAMVLHRLDENDKYGKGIG